MKKTVEDAVRELDGDLKDVAGMLRKNYVLLWVNGNPELFYLSSPNREQYICTLDTFKRLAARMGYREPNATTRAAMDEAEGIEANWAGQWLPAELVTEHRGSFVYAIYLDEGTAIYQSLRNYQIRPARTDRERWVDDAYQLASVIVDRQALFELYDAMLSGELPSPGGSDHA